MQFNINMDLLTNFAVIYDFDNIRTNPKYMLFRSIDLTFWIQVNPIFLGNPWHVIKIVYNQILLKGF